MLIFDVFTPLQQILNIVLVFFVELMHRLIATIMDSWVNIGIILEELEIIFGEQS